MGRILAGYIVQAEIPAYTKKAPDDAGAFVRNSRFLQQRLEQLAHDGRITRDLEAGLFHDRQLGIGRVLATRDQRTGVAHALARGRSDAGDEADHRLLHVVLAPARSRSLVRAADFAD